MNHRGFVDTKSSSGSFEETAERYLCNILYATGNTGATRLSAMQPFRRKTGTVGQPFVACAPLGRLWC